MKKNDANNKNRPQRTELVFILDMSGSMGPLKEDTIGGFNSMLKEQKEKDDPCTVTTILFDNEIELLHDRTDLRAVRKISSKEYSPRGMTALYDAIGFGIEKAANAQKSLDKAFQADNVLFVIMTDGLENASLKYSRKDIQKLIRKKKKKHGWQFMFLGAGIDAEDTAEELGIGADYGISTEHSSADISASFRMVSKSACMMRDCAELPIAAFDEIRRPEARVKRKKKPLGSH